MSSIDDVYKVIVMEGVNEYSEGLNVELTQTTGSYPLNNCAGRHVVRAFAECGYANTQVDLLQLLEWLAKNTPAEYMQFVTSEMICNHT